MKKLTFIPIVLALTACSADRLHIKAGMAFDVNDMLGKEHGAYIENKPSSVKYLQDMDNPNPNPLGVVMIEYKNNGPTSFFFQHVTSIPNPMDGAGLNFGGFLYEF